MSFFLNCVILLNMENQKQFQKRNFYTIKDSGNIYLYALLLPLAIGFLFSYIVVSIASSNGITAGPGENIVEILFEKYIWFAILSSILTQIVFLIIYFAFHKIEGIKFSASKVYLKKTKWQSALLAMFVGVLCVGGFVLLIECCLGKFWNIIGVKTSNLGLPLDTPAWLVANLLLLGVAPAICEELLFRGVVYQGLRNRFGVGVSVVLGGLLFALMHQNIVQFVYPFILGCVLCITFEKTNNLVYCILIHMFNNFATLILSYLINIGAISFVFSITWYFVLISIALAALTGVILWLLYRFYLKKHEKIEVEKEGDIVQAQPLSINNFPVSILVSIVLAILLIVINAIL